MTKTYRTGVEVVVLEAFLLVRGNSRNQRPGVDTMILIGAVNLASTTQLAL